MRHADRERRSDVHNEFAAGAGGFPALILQQVRRHELDAWAELLQMPDLRKRMRTRLRSREQSWRAYPRAHAARQHAPSASATRAHAAAVASVGMQARTDAALPTSRTVPRTRKPAARHALAHAPAMEPDTPVMSTSSPLMA
jgi:hypothetical protein